MNPSYPIPTVGGLLRDAEGAVLLVRTRKWSDLWGIPGGKVEMGESLQDAFLRELREETGLRAENPMLVMVQEAINHPEFHRPAHFVLINYVADVSGARPPVTLNDEAYDFVWTSLAEALRMELNGPTRTLLEKIRDERKKGNTVWIR